MGLFDAKVGGTQFGNALRQLGHSISPLLGNGAALITQEQDDFSQLTDAQYIAKYGKDKSGNVVPGVTPDPSIHTRQQEYDALARNHKMPLWLRTLWAWFKKNWYWFLIPIALVLLWKFIKWLWPKKQKSFNKKRY